MGFCATRRIFAIRESRINFTNTEGQVASPAGRVQYATVALWPALASWLLVAGADLRLEWRPESNGIPSARPLSIACVSAYALTNTTEDCTFLPPAFAVRAPIQFPEVAECGMAHSNPHASW